MCDVSAQSGLLVDVPLTVRIAGERGWRHRLHQPGGERGGWTHNHERRSEHIPAGHRRHVTCSIRDRLSIVNDDTQPTCDHEDTRACANSNCGRSLNGSPVYVLQVSTKHVRWFCDIECAIEGRRAHDDAIYASLHGGPPAHGRHTAAVAGPGL